MTRSGIPVTRVTQSGYYFPCHTFSPFILSMPENQFAWLNKRLDEMKNSMLYRYEHVSFWQQATDRKTNSRASFKAQSIWTDSYIRHNAA
jgi:hypothetical protein